MNTFGDEGIWFDAAGRLAGGERLYVDFFEFLPPGGFLIVQAWFHLVGSSFTAVRGLALLTVSAIATLIYLCCREASAKAVAALIWQVKPEKVRTYSLESAADPRLVQQVANATGAEPGGVLFVEALSAADGAAPTYAAIFRYNVDVLVAAMRPE